MDIRKIRLSNVVELLGDEKKADFADRAGLNASHLSQIVAGKSNIGDKLARKIEKNLGLAAYTLDKEGGTGEIDAGVLASIIDDVRASSEQVGLKWSTMQISRLAVNLYIVYERTGERPNIFQAVQLELLRQV